MIKLTKILQEIGDSSAKPYPFKIVDRFYPETGDTGAQGQFQSEHHDYIVDLLPDYLDNLKNVLVILFAVLKDPNDPDFIDTDIITNKGELYKVMATVTAIIKTELEDRPEIDTLLFSPAKKTKEDTSRLNLYIKYIKAEYPNAEISRDGRDVIVKFK